MSVGTRNLPAIKSALQIRIYDLIDELNLGEYRQHGTDLRFNSKGSLSVCVAHNGQSGKWFNFEAQEGGDIFDLISVRKNLSFTATIEWSIEWLAQKGLALDGGNND